MKREVYEFIWKEINENILEWRVCLLCNEDYPLFQLQKIIENKIDIACDENICSNCSIRRLMMFRNETNIYRNKCNNCSKDCISIFTLESKEIIYCLDCYDKADFSKNDNSTLDINTIEKDFQTLYKKTPKKAIINEDTENCDYANYVWLSKNVYLSFLTYSWSEDIFYSYYTVNSRDCIDCYNIRNCEKCYECTYTIESFNCYYSYNLVNSSDCYFSLSLQNCKNCLFSSNLINKEYYIYNKQYSKSEYKKILNWFKKTLLSNNWLIKLKKDYENIKEKTIYKNVQKVNTQRCAWNFISNSKNSILSSSCNSVEDSVNVWGNIISDSVNLIWWWNIQKSYNSCSVWYDCSNIISVFNTVNSNNVFNSMNIFYSNNILYSIWLKNKSFCILNKQYSKEEYTEKSAEILKKLKENWLFWSFFSNEFNNIPYNDSAAMEYFPIQKLIFPDKREEILNKDAYWIIFILEPEKFLSKAILDLWWEIKINILWKTFEKEVNIPEWMNLIKTSELPDSNNDLSNEFEKMLLSSAIICDITWRPFRIMKYELDFYKKNNISIPRVHPKIRNIQRTKIINPKNLYLTNCDNCKKEVLASYSTKEKKVIYCEKCYDEKVY